jgi:two-component SAPR family response regulator
LTNDDSKVLAGCRTLILEDEPMISMLIEDMVSDLGGEIIGPFARIAAATSYLDGESGTIDLAILDVNVGQERSFSLAERLQGLNVPVVFSTGYDDAGISAEWQKTPRLSKPFTERQLAEAAQAALKKT